LSDREAVNVAVPLKPLCNVTVKVALAAFCPPVTLTEETPTPGVADQLYTLPSSLPVRVTGNAGAFCSTVV
jgi:hypothetical protein